jgi:hypothetical protein
MLKVFRVQDSSVACKHPFRGLDSGVSWQEANVSFTGTLKRIPWSCLRQDLCGLTDVGPEKVRSRMQVKKDGVVKRQPLARQGKTHLS